MMRMTKIRKRGSARRVCRCHKPQRLLSKCRRRRRVHSSGRGGVVGLNVLAPVNYIGVSGTVAVFVKARQTKIGGGNGAREKRWFIAHNINASGHARGGGGGGHAGVWPSAGLLYIYSSHLCSNTNLGMRGVVRAGFAVAVVCNIIAAGDSIPQLIASAVFGLALCVPSGDENEGEGGGRLQRGAFTVAAAAAAAAAGCCNVEEMVPAYIFVAGAIAWVASLEVAAAWLFLVMAGFNIVVADSVEGIIGAWSAGAATVVWVVDTPPLRGTQDPWLLAHAVAGAVTFSVSATFTEMLGIGAPGLGTVGVAVVAAVVWEIIEDYLENKGVKGYLPQEGPGRAWPDMVITPAVHLLIMYSAAGGAIVDAGHLSNAVTVGAFVVVVGVMFAQGIQNAQHSPPPHSSTII